MVILAAILLHRVIYDLDFVMFYIFTFLSDIACILKIMRQEIKDKLSLQSEETKYQHYVSVPKSIELIKYNYNTNIIVCLPRLSIFCNA